MKGSDFKRNIAKQSGVKSREEKAGRFLFKTASRGYPSLLQAYRLTELASRVGFDWPNITGVLKKLDEEAMELKEAISLQNRKRIREEIGDLLFVLANIARFLHINPEDALKKTLEKFSSRFHYVETSLRNKGKSFQQSNLLEMDQLWEESKKRKRGRVNK